MVFKKSRTKSTSVLKCFISIFIVCLILVSFQLIPHSSLLACVDYNNNMFTGNSHTLSLNGSESSKKLAPPRALVIYVFGKTHNLAEQNLAFFIRTAVRESEDTDYYFILQQLDNTPFDEKSLPSIPWNAHYIQHENKCFDIGTIGWFLLSGMIDRTRYKYFIFLNSSVRGPFIASYYDNSVWYTVFTRRLNDTIKLVGSTINCEAVPHVQSYVWAMDLETLNFLLKSGTVFACYQKKIDTINQSEIGASQLILDSGFGIDSLMKKHQGMDFRLSNNRRCNNGLNPTFNKGVDGISLDPFEVVFVKMKNELIQDLDNRKRVRAYEKWMRR